MLACVGKKTLFLCSLFSLTLFNTTILEALSLTFSHSLPLISLLLSHSLSSKSSCMVKPGETKDMGISLIPKVKKIWRACSSICFRFSLSEMWCTIYIFVYLKLLRIFHTLCLLTFFTLLTASHVLLLQSIEETLVFIFKLCRKQILRNPIKKLLPLSNSFKWKNSHQTTSWPKPHLCK